MCSETNRRKGGGHIRINRHARGNSQGENGAGNHKRQRIENSAVGVVSHDAPVRPVVVQCDLFPGLPETAPAVQAAGCEADRKRLAESHRDLSERRHLQIHARHLPRDAVSGRSAAAEHGRGEGTFSLAFRHLFAGAWGASLGHHAEDIPPAPQPSDGNRSARSGVPAGWHAGKCTDHAGPAVSPVGGAVGKGYRYDPLAFRKDAQPSERRDRPDARPEAVPESQAARAVPERGQSRQAHGGGASAPAHDERLLRDVPAAAGERDRGGDPGGTPENAGRNEVPSSGLGPAERLCAHPSPA